MQKGNSVVQERRVSKRLHSSIRHKKVVDDEGASFYTASAMFEEFWRIAMMVLPALTAVRAAAEGLDQAWLYIAVAAAAALYWGTKEG